MRTRLQIFRFFNPLLNIKPSLRPIELLRKRLVDLEKINKEIKQCDEFLQEPQSEFEGIIQRNGGEIVSPNWGWKTYPSKLEELTEEESNGSYKGEF